MKRYIVYKITNTIDGKVYFGATTLTIERRWIQHKCNHTRRQYRLYRAMVECGINNFKLEIIKFCENEDEMYCLEIELIKIHNSTDINYGYNSSTGGKYSSKGNKLTVEQKLKISERQLGKTRKPFSIEVKKKMSDSAKGRDMSLVVSISALKRKGLPAKNRVSVILNNETEYSSITEASNMTGVSISAICNNLKGLSKKTKMGVWKYVQ